MSEAASGSSKRSLMTMLVLVVVAGAILALAYYHYQKDQPQLASAPALVPIAPPATETQALPTLPEPLPLYEPPPPVVEAEPLPDLNDSDASVLTRLQQLSAQSLKLVVPKEILRKFVRAVNAMDEGKVVHEYRPIVSPSPPFIAQSLGEPRGEEPRQYRLAPENFRRYDEYVTLLAMLDADALVGVYRRFSPLLEEAYSEMGLKGNFHQVLLSVMDKLMAAPVVEGELVLVRPKVFYQFADPELEKLPSTHRLMLRMGPENTRSLQTSLQLIRYKLAQ